MLPAEAPDPRRAAGPAAGTLRLLLAIAALAAAPAAGCGDDDEVGAGPAAATELTLTLDPDGEDGEAPRIETLTCPGRPEAACTAIAALPGDPAAPVPPQTACTEIYGGPDTLAIEGTLEGEPVEARFTRADGCEIERFERFSAVLRALFPDYRPGAALSP